MSLYFLRHGQSDANVAGIFSPPDAHLTELGRRQAAEAGQKLLTYDISKIVCSGLERSWETACTVADILHINPEAIEQDSRLNEYDMGSLTGMPSKGVAPHELVSAAGAEDPAAFQRRVLEAISEYSSLTGNTLVVSHAGVGCILEAKRLGIPPAKFYALDEYSNAQIIELDIIGQ